MTNEQLAVFIGMGGNDELIPLLWERIRKIMYCYSDRYYRTFNSLCDNYGITAWDIKQAAYSAFLKALEGYNKKPTEHKFASYLKYPFKNAVRAILTKDTLNKAESLNVIVNPDSDIKTERIDLLIDEEAQLPFEQVDESGKACVVRNAVDELPDELRDVIRMRYFENMTLKQCGEALGVSTEYARQLNNKALKQLFLNKDLRKLASDYGYGSYRAYHNTVSAYKRTGYSNVELIAINRADFMQKRQELLQLQV